MHPYKEIIHGGDIAGYREYSSDDGLLDFSANISPLGLPEGVRRAWAASLDEAAHYPDPHCRVLRGALAARESVPAHWILCGAGAADLIFRLAQALRPERALLLCPTFAEYELALEGVGCPVDHFLLDPAADFGVGREILERIPQSGLVLLCNPNNPSGALCKPELLREILAVCRWKGSILAVDECFVELVEQPELHTLRGELAANNHLLLLRAFTKSHAMPGLRLGYALSANTGLLGAMDRAGPAWNVSVPAQVAGVAAAREDDYLAALRELITRERVNLAGGLWELDLQVFPGEANFLLFHSRERRLAQRLLTRGVLIRDCANFRGLGPGYFRVAVRTEEENHALLAAIKEVV